MAKKKKSDNSEQKRKLHSLKCSKERSSLFRSASPSPAQTHTFRCGYKSEGLVDFSKKIIVIIVIIILVAVLFFIAVRFTGRVVRQVTGYATSTALYNCSDSDNGINYFVKGVCEDHKQKYEDACYGKTGMWEYYCARDKYSCILLESACPYGCYDGRCLKKGETATAVENTSSTAPSNNVEAKTPADNVKTNIPANNSPGEIPPNKETTKNYLNIIFIILGVIIIVFVIWFIFKVFQN